MCTLVAGLMGLQGIMGYQQARAEGQAQSAMYNAQAQQAEANAKMAERQKEQVADQYAQKQEELNARMKLARGSAVANAGASGLSMEGSPLDLLASSEDLYKKDSMNLLSNQRNDTYDLYVQAHDARQNAVMNRASASNAKKQANLSAFSSILGSASSIAKELK